MNTTFFNLIKMTAKNKLTLICFAVLGVSSYAHAEIYDYYSSSLNVSAAIAQRSSTDNVVNLSLQYSQPNSFFTYPGRSNLEFLYNVGNKGSLQKYSNVMFGLSQDFDFLRVNNFYAGVGAGFYLENSVSNLLDYQFTFGNKIYGGYQFSNSFNAELFFRHFSRNNLAINNSSLNIVGISFILNFE